MIVLYSYPEMFGLPDNNPFGLKVDTFLRLAKIDYKLEHIVDTKAAPRGQLPYLTDDGELVTDSNHIISFLSKKYHIELDNDLTEVQERLHFLLTRMLDTHLYWVISYSRWQDERFWPLFKSEFLKQFPQISESDLKKSRKHNIEKYYYQGIGRYDPKDIYASGADDLKAIKSILGNKDFIFGEKIHSIDACCYGFLANIFYCDMDTPLKAFIVAEPSLVKYINRIRGLLDYRNGIEP